MILAEIFKIPIVLDIIIKIEYFIYSDTSCHMIQHLTSKSAFHNLLEERPKLFIYKFNSRWCRVSENTILEVQAAIHEFGIQYVYLVDVIISKPLSQYIAKHSGVVHESPQLIYYKQWKPVHSTSHMHITRQYISNLIKA